MAESRRPSRVWYLHAALLLLASVAVAFASMFLSINAMQLTSVQLPGTLEVMVDEPGEWVVCIESHDGSFPAAVPMEIQFTNGLGEVRAVEPHSGSFRYRMGSVSAFEVGAATLSTGAWTLSGTMSETEGGDRQWPYAVGPSPVDRMAQIMLIGGSIAVVLLSLGLGMLVLVFWHRFRNRPGV